MLNRFFNCPRCNKGKLFLGITKFKEKCNKCGLKYKDEHIGDGASWMTTFLLCFTITPLVLFFEVKYSFKSIYYLTVILPLIAIASIIILRFIRYFLFKKTLKL